MKSVLQQLRSLLYRQGISGLHFSSLWFIAPLWLTFNLQPSTFNRPRRVVSIRVHPWFVTAFTACLLALNTLAAETPARPLHVLYLGPVSAGGSGPGGRPTDYAYLPGQTLAPEAIYFDHLADTANLTDTYLNHFDAVVEVMPDADLGADKRKMLDSFKNSGNGLLKYTTANRPTDAVLRQAVLDAVSKNARSGWETFLASRPPLQRLPGEVPNYEHRPEPIKFQAPLTPQDSMRYTQVPADFDLQLFAAEPEVTKPIFIAWDERGRAWVVEARDYPHGLVPEGQPGKSDIRICEDTDGDGKADKFTVFASGLNLPTSLVFVNGGIIVSEARHMLFLADTNGDDQADVRKVLLPGWGIADTHAMQSNLGRGFDNWLYGTVGYSNFRGNVGGKDLEFGCGIFRFKPDGSALEFLYQFSNNTWGLGQNACGDVFGSTANGNPTFYGSLPATLLNQTQPDAGRGSFRNRGAAADPQTRRLWSAHSMAPGMRMHPNTPNVREVDNFGGYTAAAGHAFMVSDALPARLQGKALVTEPTCKLVGIMDVQREGGGYKVSDGFNLLASTDEWMSPIFAEVGPDGVIWVIDFYSFIIQHNPTPNPQSAGIQATTGSGGAYMTAKDLRDQSHGRIYRVVWKDGPKSAIKSLARANSVELVQALDSGNQFWSLTAQRLLVDNNRTDAAPALKKRVKSGAGGTGAIHALWSLQGMGALDQDTHQKALLDKDPALRRNAIRALPANETGRQLFFSSPVIQDPDLLTREAAFVKLAEFPTIPEIKTVVAQLPRAAANTNDMWLNDALTLLGRIHKVSGVGMDKVQVAPGDPSRGEQLFFTSPTAACAGCHTVKGKGGAVGPILDGIALRADKAYILESLLEPNAKLAKGFENLKISPMPPMGVVLNEQDLADILAFLSTLTTPPKDGVTVPVKPANEFE
jgi:putative membrane-bound dehydrogenase-like protein